MSAPQHDLLFVEWLDSFQLEAGWHWIDDLPAHKPSLCRTVGWVIKDDDSAVSLAETISSVGDGCQVSGVVSIPVSAIVNRRTIAISSSSGQDAA